MHRERKLMAKKSLFRRFMDVIKARFGGWVEKQEDVSTLIQQELEAYEEKVENHYQAVIKVTTAQKLVEKDYENQKKEAAKYEHAAKVARAKMEEAQQRGDTETADKNKRLATEAFMRYKEILTVAEDMKKQVDEGRIQVDGLQRKHEDVKNKAAELRRKQRYLESRLKLGEAKAMIHEMNRSIEAPSSSFVDAEERILTMEAQNESHEDMASDNIEDELQALMSGAHANDDELEAFLSGNDVQSLELTTGRNDKQ